MHNIDHETRTAVAKGIIAWIAALLTDSMSFIWNIFSSTPWDKLAQFAAFIYSVCLIYQYLAKQRRQVAIMEAEDDTK